MGILTRVKAFITGKPTAEMLDRWAIKDARRHIKSANPYAAYRSLAADPSPRASFADGELEGDVERVIRLRFEYVDRNGECSVREVTDWVDTRFYVKGYCSSRLSLRTFRKDQIERWLEGAEALRHGTLSFGRTKF